jgi:hypothetical protein
MCCRISPAIRLSAFFNELDHSKFVRAVESDEEMDLALGRLHVCDINVKEPDQIALELLAPRLVPRLCGQKGFPKRHRHDSRLETGSQP